MTTARDHYEQEATKADERDYLPEEVTPPVEVRVSAPTEAALGCAL